MNRREFLIASAVSVTIYGLSPNRRPVAYTTHEGGKWFSIDDWHSMTEQEKWQNVPLRYKVSKTGVTPPAAIRYDDDWIYDRVIAKHFHDTSPWRKYRASPAQLSWV